MKKRINLVGVFVLNIVLLSSFVLPAGKLTSSKSKVSFFSHTAVEDITAVNFKTVGTLDTDNGDVVFSVPMQSFEFEKALMQKHFNSDKFLDTKSFPKAKFVGKITNISGVKFSADGSYDAKVDGELTIKGKSKSVTETGKVIVKGGKVSVQTKFDITLADYDIAFKDGKPSSNIAKAISIDFNAEF